MLLLALFAVSTALFLLFAPQLGRKPFGIHLETIKNSPQYKKNKFVNEREVRLTINLTGILKILLEMLLGAKNRRPRKKLLSQELTTKEGGDAYLTWFGHSTFLYEVDGKKILFDPMLGKHASPIPYTIRRYNYELPSSADALPPLDAVIISHDHYDHLDYETIIKIKNKTKRFITPLGVGAHLLRWGVLPEQITELDWWGETALGDVSIIATPSQHFSGRTLSDRQKTLWVGWIIKNSTAKVFFGGDSGYFAGFREIGKRHGPFDLTLLDSGQYNPRWEVVHMFPEQSVRAHKELGGKVFMPIHWSAFTLSLHSWTDPVERALIAAKKEGVEMITPIIGQRFHVVDERPQQVWWR